MVGQVYDNEECMFFVGGNTPKADVDEFAGSTRSGGCTKEWWLLQMTRTVDTYGAIGTVSVVGDEDYESLAITAMGKLMDAEGEPILSGEGVVVNGYPGVGYLGFKDVSLGAIFGNIEVGMIVYCRPDPDPVLVEGSGKFKIIAVDDEDTIYIEADGHADIEVGMTFDYYIGGANDSIGRVAEDISADAYSQEIHCNKEPTEAPYIVAVWDWEDWGYGNHLKNTWLSVLGFNRVPLDIVNERGNHHQSPMDAKVNGIISTSWVEQDLEEMERVFIDSTDGENIRISGFNFTNQSTGDYILQGSSVWQNIEISHNAFQLSTSGLNCNNGIYSFIYDNYFYTNIALAGKFVLDFTAVGASAYVKSNVFDFHGLNVLPIQGGGDAIFVSGNLGLNNWMSMNSWTGFAVNEHNTWANSGLSGGGIRVNHGHTVISVENVVIPELAGNHAFEVAANGGSMMLKRNCVFGEDGNALVDVFINLCASNGIGHENTLEVDPQFDAYNEPLNTLVREHGRDILNDPRCLGAVNAMNTGAIEAAVEAAIDTKIELASGKVTVENTAECKADVSDITAIKAKTDGLNFTGDDVKATLDSEAVKLAADGLDDLSIVEPSGDPDGWTVPQKLMWLIMRFMNKHTSDNFDGIKVYKADDTLATTQAVTEAAGVKTVGKAT